MANTNNSKKNQAQAQAQQVQQVKEQVQQQARSKKSSKPQSQDGHRNYISEALAKEVLTLLKNSVDPHPHYTTVQVILETFINMLVDRTVSGQSTTITNFATFSRRYVKDRMHKNPQTNEPAPKSEHYKMHVEVKPALKDKLEKITIAPEDRSAAK